MRKYKLIFIILLPVLMLSACSHVAELEETIEQQHNRITELEQQLEEYSQQISKQQEKNELYLLLTNDLLANYKNLNLGRILGGNPTIVNEDYISISLFSRYAIVRFSHDANHLLANVILSFELENNVDDFNWTVIAYQPIMFCGRLRLFEERKSHNLTDQDLINIRFYYLYGEIVGADNIYHYRLEEIEGEYLREEFIRLMYVHTSIEVLDLWYEDDILYIDLAPMEWHRFNWGSTGSSQRMSVFLRALSSFPDVSEVRILVAGAKDVSTNHTSFCGIFIFDSNGGWEHSEIGC